MKLLIMKFFGHSHLLCALEFGQNFHGRYQNLPIELQLAYFIAY